MPSLYQSFYFRSFMGLLCIDISYTVIMLVFNPQYYSFGHSEFISLIWFLFFYLIPIWSAAAIVFKLRKKGRTHVITELSITITFMIIGGYIVDYLLSQQFNYMPSMGIMVVFNGLLWGAVLYFSVVFIENKKRVQVEKKAKKEAQLQTLRYQLNPHFMFNSLNTISAYIYTRPDVADQVLHNLADVLRYSLDTAEKKQVSLAEELTMIDTYLAIEETRFGERLTLIKNIDNSLLNLPIPPLLLQPIIENAIKHCGHQKTLTIEITIQQHGNRMHLTVQDNGSGFSDEVLKKKYGKGIGLKNLVERIQQLPNAVLSLTNNAGACIKMELPL